MKVIATKPAFFNGFRVKPGQVLEVPDRSKGTWFTPVAKPKKADTPDAPEQTAENLV